MVAKGENARYQLFLFFPRNVLWSLQVEIVWQRVEVKSELSQRMINVYWYKRLYLFRKLFSYVNEKHPAFFFASFYFGLGFENFCGEFI